MSDAENRSDPRLRPGDRSILAFLDAEGAEYPAIVANRIGMHAPRVEERCEALADAGLIEAVSDEVVYRVTRQGQRRL